MHFKNFTDKTENDIAFILWIYICRCCGSISSLVKSYFPLFWGVAMYDNKFETKENKI